ncbi:hypothetical protein LQ327_31355 [Actinomycetospora endophytica]|uniref:DUF732 domain-containing protein n=1 Tax=Actinomycetospora endophytica TaxID=2291215 RepID=A0ABS8PKD2_9PSEU|nr:hypothetical protein [Actinomycetospora endophytica]MCD2197876.1 hypothetical protein [Actinomycetospora endophytica]
MTTTIDPVEGVDDDTSPTGSSRSVGRTVLVIGVTAVLLLAIAAGVAFAFAHNSSPAPTPVAEQAPVVPTASPTPAEQFLTRWHEVAPGVAARRSDYTWTRLGVSACNLIGVPGITAGALSRVLGSNPNLMSTAEGSHFLEVADANLCPDHDYVAAPTLTVPDVPSPSLPDFGDLSSSSGSGSIPNVHVSPPTVTAPKIPGSGSPSGSGGGHTYHPPTITRVSPPPVLKPQPIEPIGS